MMIIDNEGRFFGRVNVLDFLVIVFLLTALVLVVFKFISSDIREQSKRPMKVVVYADDIQPNVADEINSVKEVYFGRGLVKTKVQNIEVLPMPAGSRRPDFKEVRITLSGDGYSYDDGAYFGNQRVSLGKKVWVRSKYELETIVMDIK